MPLITGAILITEAETNSSLTSAALSPASASPRFAFSMNRSLYDSLASKIPAKKFIKVMYRVTRFKNRQTLSKMNQPGG